MVEGVDEEVEEEEGNDEECADKDVIYVSRCLQ